ncbi:Apoptosis-inducing factor 1 [Neofusicoccum parvum]|uniref:Apoptosis-inducing factor 1 n=1 Tax=Neofusicoccum parvum TaxID=310453 RepID=A0ACB5SB36_9PEZI|nr:Apoptosis-inducing factor 1 [Neofusicoccum parvum]
MSEAEVHSVVILGSSFGGTGIAHYLLRHVLPYLPSPAPYKVTMISPSAHLYWKIASPRTAARSDLMPLQSLMIPLETGFFSYPEASFEFIQAYASKVDPATRLVHLQPVHEQSTQEKPLHYDTLVIATGSSTPSALWSPAAPKEDTAAALKSFQHQLEPAKKIAIMGGGATGVEIAGELGFDLGKDREVVLYSGTTRLLARVRPDVGERAEQYLQDMGVEVVHGVKLVSTSTTVDGKTELTLSNGTTTSVDFFIDARGPRPNTSMLPLSWLNERGYVLVDQFLRATAAGPQSGVYAIGDAASYSNGGLLDVWDAVAPLGAVMEYDLSNGKLGAEIAYKRAAKDTMLVPVGRKRAVGLVHGVWIPNFLGAQLKKTYMLSHAMEAMMGDKWKKKKTFA